MKKKKTLKRKIVKRSRKLCINWNIINGSLCCTLYISLVFHFGLNRRDSIDPRSCCNGFRDRENRLLTTMIMIFSCFRLIHFQISLSALHFFLLLFQCTYALCTLCSEQCAMCNVHRHLKTVTDKFIFFAIQK